MVAAPLTNDYAASLANQFNFGLNKQQLLSTIALLDNLATNASSPLVGRLDTSRLGLWGHSAGCGTALQLEAELGPRVSAAAYMGTWANSYTTPWVDDLTRTVTAPTLFLSGQLDTMCEPTDVPRGSRAAVSGEALPAAGRRWPPTWSRCCRSCSRPGSASC